MIGSALSIAVASMVFLTAAPALPANAADIVGRWGFGVQAGRVPDLSGQRHPLNLSGSWATARGRGRSPAVRFRDTSIAIAKDRSVFDPGTRQFAVGIAFRVPSGLEVFEGTDSPNLVQKGRYGDEGQWKLQLIDRDEGVVQCRMKGSDGAVLITSTVGQVASDEKWHRAVCVRRDEHVALVVDGHRLVTRERVGLVANDGPLTVANQSATAPSDQFRGLVDEFVIARGAGAAGAARRAIRP
jgi:hypothetical protein